MNAPLAPKPPEQLDPDLDDMVRRAGRVPITGAAAVSGGIGSLIGLDIKYGDKLTPIATVAAGLLTLFVALVLALMGWQLRRSTRVYAQEWQQMRQRLEAAEQQAADLKQERDELRARVAELDGRARRRDPGRSTRSGRLTPVTTTERGST
jgi:hypothetical protein